MDSTSTSPRGSRLRLGAKKGPIRTGSRGHFERRQTLRTAEEEAQLGMGVVLHVVARPVGGPPAGLAEDLAASSHAEGRIEPVRVLELFEPKAGEDAVDLTLADRAELGALLRDASEVHFHGIEPARLVAEFSTDELRSMRRARWVIHGRGDGFEARGAGLEIPWIDPTRSEVLPRDRGARPFPLDDGRFRVVVALASNLDDETTTHLRLGIPSLSRPGLVVETCNERELDERSRVPMRRRAQAFVVAAPRPDALPRSLLEAMCQEIPAIVLGATTGRIGAVVLAGNDCHVAVDRALACLASWTNPWSRGAAAPVDTTAARRWVVEATAFRARISRPR